jgi:hypothetical protein
VPQLEHFSTRLGTLRQSVGLFRALRTRSDYCMNYNMERLLW